MSASKFTPEVRGALVERTATGVSLPDACREVGVREGTVKGWLTRGRREADSEWGDFTRAIENARASAKDRPGTLDREEFELRLSQAVRGGSVQAMKLWAELHPEDDGDKPPADDPLAEVDELAGRNGRGR